MGDSVDTLSSLTGIKRADMLSLWAEVKANQAKLTACRSHAFSAVEPGKVNTKYLCANCGGNVDSHAYHWYRDGREHERAAQ
jgi:hypothetical protein